MGNRTDISKKPVTQDDVARQAGVSRSIVSYVLNGGPRPVAPETRKRVLDAIEKLDYRPNKYAQNLMKSKSNAVADRQFGIILSDVFMLRRPYYADILAGIHSTAHQNNHHIRFLRFFQDLKDPLLFNELIHHEEISGLMMIALDQSLHSMEDHRLIKQIQDRISNIVCIEWELEGAPSVSFNRQEAAYKACKHLIKLGYKDIVYVGPQDNRRAGFQQALLEHNLLTEEHETIFSSDLDHGYRIALSLAERDSLPQAILGGTDEVSMGMLSGFHKMGIRVPDQIALVSIDNIEMSAYALPPLTTVNVDTGEMGAMAVRILMNRAANPDIAPASTLLPTKLIIRESCRAE